MLVSRWFQVFSSLSLASQTEVASTDSVISLSMVAVHLLKQQVERRERNGLLLSPSFAVLMPLLKTGEFRGHGNTYLAPSVKFALPKALCQISLLDFYIFFPEDQDSCRSRDRLDKLLTYYQMEKKIMIILGQ